MSASQAAHLATLRGYPAGLVAEADDVPIRMTLASMLAQLRAAGFGVGPSVFAGGVGTVTDVREDHR